MNDKMMDMTSCRIKRTTGYTSRNMRRTGYTSLNKCALLCACVALLSSTEALCRFPKHWRGRWHRNTERPLGDVTITETDIQGIGHCVNKPKESYFFMRDSSVEGDYYKCLFIIERNHNVLHYRESHSVAHQGYQSLCRSINVENTLYTLIKTDAHAIQCPLELQGQYSITYNNNTELECISTKSKMTSCASGKHIHFQYGSCPFTTDEEYTIDCLSTWKDRLQYIYASVNYQQQTGSRQEPPIYRCFVVEKYNFDVRVSISIDTSCRPHMKLTLTQLNLQDPQNTCNFPRWLENSTWLDFAGESIYHVTEGQLSINRYKDLEDTGRATYRFTCLSIETSNISRVVMKAQTVHRCTSYRQCISIQMLEPDVIQISLGDKLQSSSLNCEKYLSIPSKVHTGLLLIKENVNRVDKCSIEGSYMTALSRHHPQCTLSSVHAGCTIPSVLTLYNMDLHGQIAPESFRCMAQWSDSDLGNEYTVVRTENSQRHTCITLHTDNWQRGSVISVNDLCQHNVGNICIVKNSTRPCANSYVYDSTGRSDTSLIDGQNDGQQWPPSGGDHVNTSCMVSMTLTLIMSLVTYKTL